MQTFITLGGYKKHPAEIFKATAEVLDNKRLNKQALEAWQILMTNLRLNPDGTIRTGKGWLNHPATQMWKGCDLMLLDYINAMEEEWLRRGYETTIGRKARQTIADGIELGLVNLDAPQPLWMKNQIVLFRIARNHRQALLVKNWKWYSEQFSWMDVKPLDYQYDWYPSGYQSKARELQGVA